MAVRIRQVVLAVEALEAVADRLADALHLREPFADPLVAYFGLRNAVFALGDTFLEVLTPTQPDTAAGRLLAKRGGDCGYMVIFQTDDLAGARARAVAAGLREVFRVDEDDIAESHLHPADVGGAIVAVTQPEPPPSWRWGGPGWTERSAPLTVAGITVAVRDPDETRRRWEGLLGVPADEVGLRFEEDPLDAGLVEVRLSGERTSPPLTVGGVRVVPGG